MAAGPPPSGHRIDLFNDLGPEAVMDDIAGWISAHVGQNVKAEMPLAT
ncbi:MAG: hypothetical protein ABI422_04465 [Sphingomicrobium sp.]